MRLLPWVVLGLGSYLIWKASKAKPVATIDVPINGEIPPGAQPTGRIQRTTNGNLPDDPTERLGYAVREFVEIMLPNGQLDWLEINREQTA